MLNVFESNFIINYLKDRIISNHIIDFLGSSYEAERLAYYHSHLPTSYVNITLVCIKQGYEYEPCGNMRVILKEKIDHKTTYYEYQRLKNNKL